MNTNERTSRTFQYEIQNTHCIVKKHVSHGKFRVQHESVKSLMKINIDSERIRSILLNIIVKK